MYFTVYWQENITKTLWDRTQYRHIQPLRSIHNVLQSLDPDFMQKLESEDEKFKGIIGYIGRRNKTSEVVYEKARANSDYYFDTENSLIVATGSVGSPMYRDQVANDSNICLAMGLEFSTGDFGHNFKPWSKDNRARLHSLAALRGNEVSELDLVLPELKENNFQIRRGVNGGQRLAPVYLNELKVSRSKIRSKAPRRDDKAFEKAFIRMKRDNPLFKNLIRSYHDESWLLKWVQLKHFQKKCYGREVYFEIFGDFRETDAKLYHHSMKRPSWRKKNFEKFWRRRR